MRADGGPGEVGAAWGRFAGLGGGPAISVQRRDKALGRGRPRPLRPVGEPREMFLSGPPLASGGFFGFIYMLVIQRLPGLREDRSLIGVIGRFIPAAKGETSFLGMIVPQMRVVTGVWRLLLRCDPRESQEDGP